MIDEKDYGSRGWIVKSIFSSEFQCIGDLVREMDEHPESPGKSSIGTRNLLSSFVLSMKPKIILEVGGHIGSASVSMGASLKLNGFGSLYTLEPQDHYYDLLCGFVKKAGIEDYVFPLKMLSTDDRIPDIMKEKADMIFLDANHSYSHVMADLDVCDRVIAQNGLIFLDDVGEKMSASMCKEQRGGVRQALLDYTNNRKDLKVIFFEHPFWLNPCGLALVCKQNPDITN